jgi:hypothetical protein
MQLKNNPNYPKKTASPEGGREGRILETYLMLFKFSFAVQHPA